MFKGLQKVPVLDQVCMTYGSSAGYIPLSHFIGLLHFPDKMMHLAGPVPSVINHRNSSHSHLLLPLQTRQSSGTLHQESSTTKWCRRHGGAEALGHRCWSYQKATGKKGGYRGGRKQARGTTLWGDWKTTEKMEVKKEVLGWDYTFSRVLSACSPSSLPDKLLVSHPLPGKGTLQHLIRSDYS